MGDQALKECPFCFELIKVQALKCHHCHSFLGAKELDLGQWYRSRNDKVISGVCAGVARRIGFSVTTVRLAFIVLTLLGGHGVLLYIILRLLMPEEPPFLTSSPVAPA